MGNDADPGSGRARVKLGVLFISAIFLSGCFAPARRRTIHVAVNPSPQGEFLNPVKKGRVVSGFGKRGRRGYHTGIDIQRKPGANDPILASREGSVVFVGKSGAYGRMIIIKHGDGYKTRYAHLKTILVQKGQLVNAGKEIGVMGQSGRASGVHLHFEILTPGGQFVDPKPLVFP